MIEKVAIVHSELQTGEYRLLNDYLRLCGISVYDYRISKDKDMETDLKDSFDIVFVIATKPMKESSGLSSSNISLIKNRFPEAIFLGKEDQSEDELNWKDSDEKNLRRGFIQKCVEKMIEKVKAEMTVGESALLEKALKCIGDVFVEYDLTKYRTAVHIFLNMNKVLEEALVHFRDAYIELCRKEKQTEYQDCKYYLFAQRYIERYINQICSFLKEKPIFSTEEEIKWLDERIKGKKDGVYFQARLCMLKGVFYECNDDYIYKQKCVESYREAISLLEGESQKWLAFYANYRCGRAYQRYLQDWDTAIGYYRKASEIDSEDYRAVYKLGEYELVKKTDYREAAEHFYKIITILRARSDNNCIQPLEAEYIYKAWYFLEAIYRSVKERQTLLTYADADSIQKVSSSIQMFLSIVRDRERKNTCYEVIFGPDGKICDYDARVLTEDRVTQVCRLI